MPKPKIFISHSAKEAPTRKLLDALSVALEQTGFDVLLDMKRLNPGAQWRDELIRWIGQCHGAVVLFSGAALNSDWVLNESSILTYRRDSARLVNLTFDVLPVLLPPVTLAQLKNTKFSPLEINAIQTINGETDEAVIEKIIRQLTPLKERFGDLSPFGKVQERVVAFLDKINRDEVIEKIIKSFNLDQAIFGDGVNKKNYLADHTLRNADYGLMLKVISDIALWVEYEKALEICHIVWPFCWVDQAAASRIPAVMQRPLRKRLLAINSERKKTVEMYIDRAYEKSPPPCTLKGLSGGYSAAQVEETLADVRATIKEHLGFLGEASDEELNDELDFWGDKRQLILLVRPPLPDQDVIEKVAAAFPQITYIFSGQMDFAQFRELNQMDVEFLLPELDQKIEEREYRRFGVLLKDVGEIFKKPGENKPEWR